MNRLCRDYHVINNYVILCYVITITYIISIDDTLKNIDRWLLTLKLYSMSKPAMLNEIV